MTRTRSWTPVFWKRSGCPPKSWRSAAPVARLEPPDDALLAAVLVKLFTDRQLPVAPEVVSYLVSRMDRSFAAAERLVARLDAAGLERRRRITRSLAAEVLHGRT